MPYIWIWLRDCEGTMHRIKALVDSGCTNTTIGENFVKGLGLRTEKITNPHTVQTGNGPLEITHEIKMLTWFGTHKVDEELIRFEVGLVLTILIGMDIQHGNNWNKESDNGLIRTKYNSEIPLIGSEIYESAYAQYVFK
ncbi:hypothetical protein RclHR1_22710002 [Rhizophagus clarus]|nr:hypothetical protein RclHR1_22710002 [Rhizophagus clarus]